MKPLNNKQIIAHITINTGGDVRALAEKQRISHATLYRAISRKIDSPRARQIICDVTGLDETQIWDGKVVK